MRSFSILSLAATVAFSAFSSAAPVDVNARAALGAKVSVRRGLADVDVKNIKVLSNRDLIDADVEDVKVLSSRGGDLVDADLENIDVLSPRDLPSVPQILNDVTTQLQPIVEKINNITGADDLVAELTPLVGQVTTIVGSAVKNVNALVSANVKVQVDVSAVAQLVAQVLTLVIGALNTVVKVAGGDVSQVTTLLGQVNDVLTQLIKALLSVVDGLLAALIPLVGGLVSTITTLGFSTLGSVLNLL